MSTTVVAPPWRNPFTSATARLLLVGVLFLLLQIPQAMIGGVVSERAERRGEAAAEVTGIWGGAQDVVGPVLRLPCVYRWREKDRDGIEHERVATTQAWFLPERLDARAVLETETRTRGLFEVPVYAAALTLSGVFARPDPAQCPQAGSTLDWSRAELVLGISDPRSLQADAVVTWNGAAAGLKPATGSSLPLLASGVHVPLSGFAEAFTADTAAFALTLGFNGSDRFQLAPVAKEVTATLASNWPHPGFQGGWLPVKRSVGDAGFDAQWSVSYLGRDYPQAWFEGEVPAEALGRSLFGVALTTPLDHYVLSQRITKYAVLIVLFTLLTVWLTETLGGARVHLIQYGFLGASLCLFGLLELALAEHLGFTLAFTLAAVGIVGQVTLYCRTVLGGNRRALLAGGVLSGLYLWLYAILRAEDYALLGGALALFALLGCAMYLTRNVNWFGAPAPNA